MRRASAASPWRLLSARIALLDRQAAQGSASGPDRMCGFRRPCCAAPAQLRTSPSVVAAAAHYGTPRIPVQTQYARKAQRMTGGIRAQGHYLPISDRLAGRRPVACDRRVVARAHARGGQRRAPARRRRASARTRAEAAAAAGPPHGARRRHGRGRAAGRSSRRGRGCCPRPTSGSRRRSSACWSCSCCGSDFIVLNAKRFRIGASFLGIVLAMAVLGPGAGGRNRPRSAAVRRDPEPRRAARTCSATSSPTPHSRSSAGSRSVVAEPGIRRRGRLRRRRVRRCSWRRTS